MPKRTADEPEMVEQLRQAIRDCGLSLYEIQAQTGVNRGQISRFLSGERDLTLTVAARIMEVIGGEFRFPKPKRRKT